MFNPIQQRAILQGKFGYQRYLSKDVDELRRNNTLCAYGRSAANEAFSCYLCNLEEPGRRLLEFAAELIAEAISTGQAEQRGHGELLTGYHSLAMCRWILLGEDDHDSLAGVIKHSRIYWANQHHKPDKETLDIELPMYLNARDATYVCEVAEASEKCKIPNNLAKIRSSRVMAYVLAKRKTEGGVDDKVTGAFKAFLDQSIDEVFLERGLSEEASLWLKIAYWNDSNGSLSPRDVVLKAYDHMPNVNSPTWVGKSG